MIDISAQFGWTLSELIERMPPKELTLRVVRAMNAQGYTYNPGKMAEIRARQEQEALEQFMADAREHWSKSKA